MMSPTATRSRLCTLLPTCSEHLADLPVLPFMDRNLNHGRTRILFDHAHLGRRGHEAADVDSFAELRQTGFGEDTCNCGDVGFAYLMFRMGQGIGQFTIVGHKQKAGGVVVKSAHRKQPLRNVRHQVGYRRAILIIIHGRNITERLVDGHINFGRIRFDLGAIDGDHIPILDLSAHFTNDSAVDFHISIGNQLIGFSAGADAG